MRKPKMDKQLFKTKKEVEDFSNFFHAMTEKYFSEIQPQLRAKQTRSLQLNAHCSSLTANIGRKAV